MNMLREAVTRLEELGLVAQLSENEDESIVSGIERTNDLGFNVYMNGFHIASAADGWEVTISGPGQLNSSEPVVTLPEAIATVQRILSDRRINDIDDPRKGDALPDRIVNRLHPNEPMSGAEPA
jgi:hypothetical protein